MGSAAGGSSVRSVARPRSVVRPRSAPGSRARTRRRPPTSGAAFVPRYLPFHGPHQTGIVSPPPAAGLMAAFDVTAADRDELVEAFRALRP